MYIYLVTATMTDRNAPTASDRNRASMLADLALVRSGVLMPTAAELKAETARQLLGITMDRMGTGGAA